MNDDENDDDDDDDDDGDGDDDDDDDDGDEDDGDEDRNNRKIVSLLLSVPFHPTAFQTNPILALIQTICTPTNPN